MCLASRNNSAHGDIKTRTFPWEWNGTMVQHVIPDSLIALARVSCVVITRNLFGLLLLFVWNTQSFIDSLDNHSTVSGLRVGVAGLQGMQWVGTLQQCALWSGGSLRRGKQVMRSCPIGGEIRRIWLGHISYDSKWRIDVSVEWTQVSDTLDQSRDHVRVAPLESTTAPMSSAPFDFDLRVVQPRSRKAGEIWKATWVFGLMDQYGKVGGALLLEGAV